MHVHTSQMPVLEPGPEPTAAEQLTLRTEVDATLAKRSLAGVAAYLILLGIFLAITPAARLHPLASAAATAWMVVLSVVRITVARAFTTMYPARPVVWARTFRCVTLVAGTSWGIGCALWIHAMGLGADSLVMLVSTAGATAGATSSLGPSVRLARAYVVGILGPTIVSLVLFGDGSRGSIGFALIELMYLGFLAVEAGHANKAFILGIERNFLLQRRATELADRTHRMKVILDTVGQGFLSVDLDGTMANERSSILERWLGASRAGDKVWDYLGHVAPDTAVWIEIGFGTLASGALPTDLVVYQLPRRLRAGDRHLDIEYRLTLEGETVTKVLMILSDVTSEIERQRSEQERGELLSVFEHIVTDRGGVLDFVADTDQLVQQLAREVEAPEPVTRRWLHTLKGNAAIFGLEGLSRACHELESALDDTGEPVTQAQRDAIVELWRATARRITGLLGSDEAVIQVARGEYTELAQAIANGVPHAQLSALVKRWSLESAETRLARIAQQARGMARRLDKGEISVVIESNGLRLPADQWGKFWGAFVHVVRNAVDHGLETPEDRIAAGKPGTGTLTLRTFIDAADLVVSIEDDGRGIDWDRVASSADARGLAHGTPAELEAVLFADGVTTKEVANEMSGRGVGMGAILAEVHSLGGRLSLSSETGRGTRCAARFPRALLDATPS